MLLLLCLVGSTVMLGTSAQTTTAEPRPAKQRHISEFTDVKTGKNPFLDLTEGEPDRHGWASPDTTPWTKPSHALPVPNEGPPGFRKHWFYDGGGGSGRGRPTARVRERPATFAVESSTGVGTSEPSAEPTDGPSREDSEADGERSPSNPSVVYSALLIGGAVVFFACIMGACLWRSRRKRFAGGIRTVTKPVGTAAQAQKKDGLLNV